MDCPNIGLIHIHTNSYKIWKSYENHDDKGHMAADRRLWHTECRQVLAARQIDVLPTNNAITEITMKVAEFLLASIFLTVTASGQAQEASKNLPQPATSTEATVAAPAKKPADLVYDAVIAEYKTARAVCTPQKENIRIAVMKHLAILVEAKQVEDSWRTRLSAGTDAGTRLLDECNAAGG